MKRTHRRVHAIVWIVLPVLLILLLWTGFSIHETHDLTDHKPSAEGAIQ